jgi:hypothetical protein
MVSAREIAEAVFIGGFIIGGFICGLWLLDSYLGEAGIQLKRGTSSRGDL